MSPPLCRYAELTGLDDLKPILSREQRDLYILNNATLTFLLLTSSIGALLLSGILFLVQLAAEGARVRREARASKARRLRHVEHLDEVVAPVLAEGHHWHLFLSHVWGTGQDQMRIIKQRLLEMVPGALRCSTLVPTTRARVI